MGEVFRAFDTRLERSVAIKVIRSERATSDVLRERFRREARAAASLTHAAIVQIHDVISHGEVECIVMELVEGRTLASMLRHDGALEVVRVIKLGREIAGGLAEAHDKDIVHRDLKAENIMVTPAGHAKILDFGLAKRILPGTEPSLTVDGGVIGTWHAMAPEQARGLPVDHRADLFSFGVLLYQTLVGEAPFGGTTPVATLTKVCVEPHVPVIERLPEVPPALSALIDRLLEKAPEMRPRAAAEVAATLDEIQAELSGFHSPAPDDLPSALGGSALDGETWPDGRPPGAASKPYTMTPPATAVSAAPAAGKWWKLPSALLVAALAAAAVAVGVAAYFQLQPSPPEVRYVAVTRPLLEAPAGEIADADLLTAGVRAAATRGLLALEGLSPIASDQVDAVEGTSLEVARAVAASDVVASSLSCNRARCQVTLDRIDAGNGGIVAAATFQAPADDPLLLRTAVSDKLATLFPGQRRRSGAIEAPVRGADYEAYLRLRQQFYDRGGDGGSLAEIEERLTEITRSSPRFLEAHLLAAKVGRFRFHASREPADFERALSHVERARRLAPEDPQPLFQLVDLALQANRLETAQEGLDALALLEPGHARVQAQRALLLEMQGQGEQALALMRKAAAQHPSYNNLLDLAKVASRQGATEVARDVLQKLLDRFPEDFEVRVFLAQLELLERPERAAELYEALVERSADLQTLSNLGLAYFLLERWQDAASAFRRALELAPEAPFALLNVADSELLLGRSDEAKSLYRQVVDLIDRDPAGDQWQSLTVKSQALAHLGRSSDAVAAIQQALRIAADNPQVAYEAAVVYALIGDQASAIYHSGRAIGAGFDRRWFQFPWFEPLRSDPSFRNLVGAELSR